MMLLRFSRSQPKPRSIWAALSIDYLNRWFIKLKFQCCHQICTFMCPKSVLGTNLEWVSIYEGWVVVPCILWMEEMTLEIPC